MTQARACRWCGADISGLPSQRVTCGHPICRTKQNRQATPTQQHKASVKHAGAKQRGTLRVLSAWEKSGAQWSEWDRLVFTARESGENIATVLGTLRAEGLIK